MTTVRILVLAQLHHLRFFTYRETAAVTSAHLYRKQTAATEQRQDTAQRMAPERLLIFKLVMVTLT
jgi:hypothetical protein